jgi:hypothetical protein
MQKIIKPETELQNLQNWKEWTLTSLYSKRDRFSDYRLLLEKPDFQWCLGLMSIEIRAGCTLGIWPSILMKLEKLVPMFNFRRMRRLGSQVWTFPLIFQYQLTFKSLTENCK